MVAVNGARRGIHEMLRARLSRRLEQVEEPNHVSLDIGARIVERVAHAGLRRHMHDALWTPPEERHHCRLIAQVSPDELEGVVALQASETGFLQRHVVVRLSKPITASPRSSSRSVTKEPMNPAAPVTSTRIFHLAGRPAPMSGGDVWRPSRLAQSNAAPRNRGIPLSWHRPRAQRGAPNA